MACQIVIENESGSEKVPQDQDFQKWALAVLPEGDWEIDLRLVGLAESQALNRQYRHQNKPTNVLSFPSDLPPEIDLPLLGDIAICVPVVEQEALEQGKPLAHHWAHLFIHGILHLQGFDHQTDDDAEQMEKLEIEILDRLGISNPYQ